MLSLWFQASTEGPGNFLLWYRDTKYISLTSRTSLDRNETEQVCWHNSRDLRVEVSRNSSQDRTRTNVPVPIYFTQSPVPRPPAPEPVSLVQLCMANPRCCLGMWWKSESYPSRLLFWEFFNTFQLLGGCPSDFNMHIWSLLCTSGLCSS